MKYITNSISDKHSTAEDFIQFIGSNPNAGFIKVEELHYYLLAVEECDVDPEYTDPSKYGIEDLSHVEKGKVYNSEGKETFLELETEEGTFIYPDSALSQSKWYSYFDR